jgi:hypothetical protein
LQQGVLNGSVACEGLGLIVASAENRLRAQPGGQRRNRPARAGVAHDQRCAAVAQSGVDIRDRRQNELHPPVSLRPALQQRIEDVAVELKRQRHLVAGAQGSVQRRVVMQSQIATQPNQTERQPLAWVLRTSSDFRAHRSPSHHWGRLHSPAPQALRVGAINSTP